MDEKSDPTAAWPENKVGVANTTADIANLLDMLPDDSAAFGYAQPAPRISA